MRLVSWIGIAQFTTLPLLTSEVAAQPAATAPNQIVTDGRTQTSVTTSGNVTNITTTTVSGANAFNSFSQFGVGQGNTVNLQLPGGTQNLINVVRDAPAYVNGTLNSYANGAIGGNVYFVDPHGFLVGASGTVNVGSLNISTPTREFTEQLIGSGGQINGTAVGNLMAGSFPISADGNIRILGRVNAADGVRLTGQNVTVGGEAGRRARMNQDHAAQFAASVNSKGLKSANGIVVRNGSIEIVAAGDANVSGRLVARSKTTTPSNVTVTAGNNVTVGKDAKIVTASKAGDAGDVLLKAGNNLSVASGANIDASSKTGNAGLVDLSANGTFDIASGVTINLAAPNGTAGTLLIDPTDIVIGDATQGDAGVTMSNATVASAIAALSAGGTFVLAASNSITLDAHAVIDTRRLNASNVSTGNAYNIEIDAPTISVLAGAKILAQAVNTGSSSWTSGNVALNATASQTLVYGLASASTSITVDGTITGANISIGATSSATSSALSSLTLTQLEAFVTTTVAAIAGLNGGYVAANASAVININTHASITGSGNITIAASATQDAEDPVVASALAGGVSWGAAVVVGAISGTSTANVASGATINAGGSLAISADNTATLSVLAATAASSAQVAAAVAYSTVNVTTTANVASGANISAGTANGANNGFSLTAVNNNSFSTSATAVALSTWNASGSAGGAIAISNTNTSATATLGASLGSSGAAMNGNVVVAAISNGAANATMASTIVGTPFLIAKIQGGLVTSVPVDLFKQQTQSKFASNFDFKAAAALTLATSSESASASIAQTAGGSIPSIYASGNVAVVSDVIDAGVRSQASSAATASDPVDGESKAVSAAVAWGSFTHNTDAFIGAGVTINASNIGVAANTAMPITNNWLIGDSLSTVIGHINGSLGVTNDILTSYANATADAGQELGIAGSMSQFAATNNTMAWVGSDAHLTASCLAGTGGCSTDGSWSPALGNSASQSFAASLAVVVTATTESISVAGNIGFAGLLPGNSSGGSSVGGSLNLISFTSDTTAGVSMSAVLNAANNIDVNANTTDQFFGIAPSSGIAAGTLVVNGISSMAFIDDVTHASISSSATVSAPKVTIDAEQNLSALSLAGAIDGSGNNSVGISFDYINAITDTAAYIGDNHLDVTSSAFVANDPLAIAAAFIGTVSTDSLVVNAITTGRITSASYAAAISDPAIANYANKMSALRTAQQQLKVNQGFISAKQAFSRASAIPPDGFTLDAAGTSSVTDVALATSAYTSNVHINRLTANGTTATTTIQALNSVTLDNGAGAAAINLAGGSSSSAAVAGAIAMAMSANSTTAYVSSTTISNMQSVSVQALNGGSEMAVAIGAAGSDEANSIAMSLSIGLITDSTQAYIANSTISGLSGGSLGVSVVAYQTTNIEIGGGSLFISGGQAGAGLSLTYASIADPSGGNATDAHITGTAISNYNALTVLADNASIIGAGAAAAGGGEETNSLAGAVVVDDITPTTMAYINNFSSTNTITIAGNVTVTADSADVASLDTVLANHSLAGSDTCVTSSGSQSCVDFSGAALNGGAGAAPGAAIYSAAGFIQVGKANVGASLVYDNIATTHSAGISDVLLTSTNGTVAVNAKDSSKIVAVTVGFGLASGQFAGVAGTTVSTIGNTVSASVGDGNSTTSNSTISAANLRVAATDTSGIIATSIAAGASTEGSAAGLAIVYNSIANDVSAGVSSSLVNVSGDVAVGASSTASITAAAVGIAMSSQVGLAGSVTTNVMGSDVAASISGGADVTAANNVSVLASNSDSAAVMAGALSVSTGPGGGAGSMVTNKITGTTSASISGATTKVDALGTSASDTLALNSGTLANAVDLGAFNAPTATTPDLTETQDHIKGLAVVASSHQAVVTNVGSVAASDGIAIMVNPITNVMSGTTSASIDGASIDTRLTSSTLLPQVDVAASSFSYSGAFGFGATIGTAGGGATVISTTMDRATFATITNATVGGTAGTSPTLGAVIVKANAEQDASTIAIGFNAGSVGLNVFLATTKAYVDGGSLTASSLAVAANDSTGIASANGSAAYGSSVGVGAAFLVQVSQNTTEAYVGDEYHYEGTGAAHTTAVNLSGALSIAANTTDNFTAYSLGGALGGSGAFAGMANIEIASNTTIAGLYDTTVQSPSGGAAGAVSIDANETVSIKEIAGALVLGGSTGIGAAANVVSFKSATIAESRNSNVNSSGVVDVEAQSTKEVLSYAVTGGIGGSVGLSATVGVILIGTNSADSDTLGQENGQLSGTLAMVNSATNSGQGSGAVASGTAGSPANANASSTYDVSSVLTSGNDGVTAQIAGGHVTAGEVDVGATSATATKMYLLGAGFGESVGVGAAVGYTNVSSTVLANLNAIVSAPAVSVVALVKDPTTGPYAGHTVDTTALAGGGALYFGADAAVAIGNVANTVTAELGGSVAGSSSTGGVLINANDTSTVDTLTRGASGGIVAVGASVATAGKSSSVSAKVLSSATINAGMLIVSASDSGALSASATAMGGGVIAAQGAGATATETSSVLAEIGASSSVTTASSGPGVFVSATSSPTLSAQAAGLILASGALGASVAESNLSQHVTADVGDNTSFSGGSLTVTAMALVPSSGYTAYATAVTGSGGWLLGVQGSYAQASDDSTVEAYGGANVHLPLGMVTFAAENDSSQYARATGVATGYDAAGASVAQASSSAHTLAYLGAGAVTDAANLGVLQITATGNDTNVADAIAGSGGVAAGAAAVATTSSTATTNATLYGNGTTDTLYLGGLNVQAAHTINYLGDADGYQASTVGASGGATTNTVTSNTTAEIGTNLIINSAAGDMVVIANDIVNQTGGGARAGSGGVAAGAATISVSTVTQTVNTNLDAGTILSLNDDPTTSTAKINIEAYNTVKTTDTTSLSAGGVFAGGGAESDMTANATVNVNIQATELFSAGNLYIGTASQMQVVNNANANLYGVVTGAGASTNSTAYATQNVTVGSSSLIQAWGVINIYAGQAGDGSAYSTVTAAGTTVVYNYALIPISAEFRGTGSAQDYSTLTLASGSQVLGANNVFLGATQGLVNGGGSGTAYNPYLTAFSTANYDNHSYSNGSGTASLNGLVMAGIYNEVTINIALGATTPTLTLGTSRPSTVSAADWLQLVQVSDVSDISPVMSYNHQQIQYAMVGGFNPYQTIVNQLVSLSGLTQAQVQTALSSASPAITISAASDPTGDIQRQINTLIQQAPFATNTPGSAFAFGNILGTPRPRSPRTIPRRSRSTIRASTSSRCRN